MQPRIWFFLLLVSLGLLACTKDTELAPTQSLLPPELQAGSQQLATGSFRGSGRYQVMGTAKVLVATQDPTKRFLAMENFSSDTGPDLRVYLAEDANATNFIELAVLEKSGTFYLPIPPQTDLKKQKAVLIWCKRFSVLFGISQLQ
ncbi:MAG: DM13 domain-containing protein [Bernardetiaceae bacterium]|nr:DM13 domain-containing protein [Bernardetiaceae bacterium]